MAQQAERTVAVGVFENRPAAEAAIERLRDAGFRDEEVGFLHHGENTGKTTDQGRVESETKKGAATGATAGGVIGGISGALLAGLIPGIGPALAGGILVGVLAGASIGAAGGVVPALVDLGVPEGESRFYEQQFAGGRSILAVKAGNRYNEAADILQREGAAFVHMEKSRLSNESREPENLDVIADSGTAVENERGTSTEDVAINGYGATGEGAPRRNYDEGAFPSTMAEDPTGTSVDDAISGSGAVRAGPTGWSFGEAMTGGGTQRPGSTGGAEIGTGSPGDTHDVGVRGQGSQGEGRTRFGNWEEIGPGLMAQWRRRHGGDDSTWREHEPVIRFGWERAMAPEREADHWAEAEPMLRQDWEAEHPETPWITVADLVREGWESAKTTSRADISVDESAPSSMIDRNKAA